MADAREGQKEMGKREVCRKEKAGEVESLNVCPQVLAACEALPIHERWHLVSVVS